MKITAAATASLVMYSTFIFAQARPIDNDLLTAANRGECRQVENLLKKGANPNAVRDDEMATPLMKASVACQAPVLTQLLNRGAEVDAHDQHGATALMYAIDRDPPEGQHRKFQLDAIRALLAGKASVAIKDADGATMLHYAARQRNLDVLKMFMSVGIAIDTRDKDGATPLFNAVVSDQQANVELLLAAGADANVHLNAGVSALSIAEQRGFAPLAQLLRARGARADAPTPAAGRGSPARGPANMSPIDGITFEQWARANGRLTAGVTLPTVLQSLKVDEARWERAHEQWTERLAASTLTLGADYARHFRAAMEEEATKAGEPATTPITFEKWVEVLEATSAASRRLPELYGMSAADWTRVNGWWNQRLNAKQVDKAVYDQLSRKFEKQFAAAPPQKSAPVLRAGALEANREPVSLQQWVEMQQAASAAQDWTVKRQGLTMPQWMRGNMYWGQRFNQAVLRMDSAPPTERAETARMHAERLRLSELYQKKYSQGLPW